MNRDFSFPLIPYENQINFMNDLYYCLSNCKGGLFESPTGTGKSLSIICASLTFLTDICTEKLHEAARFSTMSNKKYKQDFSGLRVFDLKNMTRDKNPDSAKNLKILYLSRTHSQLDQFIKEIKRTKWGRDNKIRFLRLGSRSQMCINDDVLKNKAFIEFRCKELTKNKKNKDLGELEEVKNADLFLPGPFKENEKKNAKKPAQICEFFEMQSQMTEYLFNRVCDIEDLVTAGRTLKACPYFGTRSAIKDADFILAPYSSVLNKHNRHAIGIDLNECYVIIDESHNIIEAITEYHSASITKKQLASFENQIKSYKNTFYESFFARKTVFVNTALRVVEKFLSFINSHEESLNYSEDRNVFIDRLDLSSVEFFYLWDFFEEDQLISKIHNHILNVRSNIPPNLTSIKAFVEFILSINEKQGKILLSKDPDSSDFTLKFLLLDPFNKFQKLLDESLCVVLAGGTLTPNQEFLKLFSGIEPRFFKQFSCGHVIPKENILLSVITTSPSNQEFKFVYENRDNKQLFRELLIVITDLACVVPNGMIVFVPSYAFLKKIQSHLAEGGFERLSSRKKIFFDAKDENILKEFSETAERAGSILFAVVRGTLSEGISFNDRLGRCVVMVGMPYLNMHDLEVSVKMSHYDRFGGSYTGREYYDNACHIAINQSIGRVIRHSKDFAAIVLIDSRHYASKNKRPYWMMRSFVEPLPHQQLMMLIRNFFRSKINTD